MVRMKRLYKRGLEGRGSGTGVATCCGVLIRANSGGLSE